MKYRVEIYDETYLINAKTLDGAIRGATARYANKSPSAVYRHCQPSRISRNSTFCDDRVWRETGKSKPAAVRSGRWRKCQYLVGVTAIVAYPVESTEQSAPSEPNPEPSGGACRMTISIIRLISIETRVWPCRKIE
jgi:hypothetical protein